MRAARWRARPHPPPSPWSPCPRAAAARLPPRPPTTTPPLAGSRGVRGSPLETRPALGCGPKPPRPSQPRRAFPPRRARLPRRSPCPSRVPGRRQLLSYFTCDFCIVVSSCFFVNKNNGIVDFLLCSFVCSTWNWKGYNIRYQCAGTSGPALVLIHGFGANRCASYTHTLIYSLLSICRQQKFFSDHGFMA